MSTVLNFSLLRQAVQRQFNQMKTGPVFRVAIDKEAIWSLYLSSFPEGANDRFRERSEHDCSACRNFIKNAGGMVTIENGELVSLWDIQVEGYQPVVEALAQYVKSLPIENVFLYPVRFLGTNVNYEPTDAGTLTWEHLYVTLPPELYAPKATIPTKLGGIATTHQMALRALKEITTNAIETVQDLIAQNSLYRGSEKSALVNTFATIKREFDTVKDQERFVWCQVVGVNAWACRLRGDVIGTLLEDLSEGKDLEASVKSFEDKVSGTNYKRPTALITPKMRDAAKQKLVELGLLESLGRRYAHLEDVSITNVLFADRSAKTRISGDVFDDLPLITNNKKFDRVEEVTIEKFLADILPTARSLEILVENKHSGNLVSLIAPEDLNAKTLFKWNNAFSWSYNGDVADSIKERVKSAGGNVTGDVCCRLAWYNTDDLDLHMREPGGSHIFYGAKISHRTHGQLDVDMNAGGRMSRTPVENIYYGQKASMTLGEYLLYVNQYSRRETKDVGFEVEIDILGTLHHFSYSSSVTGNVEVVKLKVSASGVEVIPILPSSTVSKEVWGIKTQEFHPVMALMLSPNYWDGKGVGNKHYFFMLDKCKNDGSARGFYNEFLSSELEPHRKTMEIVGSKMRTDQSEDQLSGLGFSSTLHNSIVVKVGGTFTRTLKVNF